MAYADRTTLDALLQDDYLPGIRNYINNHRPLWDRIEKVSDVHRFQGRRFVVAIQLGNSGAVGARAEGGTLPVPANISLANMTQTVAYHYATVRLSRQIISSANKGESAFASAIDQEVMSARDELEWDLALNGIYGAGYGDMGQVSSYASTTLTMLNTPTTVGAPGADLLKRNMVVDSYSALSGGSAGASNITISSVNRQAGTAVVPSSAGFNANDYVFRQGSRGTTMMGLGGIVDDGTRVGTFQNLSRTTYPELKANVLSNSGTLRAWSPALMDQGASEGWANGGGKWPSAAYSRLEIQRRAADYIRSDRRADMKEMTLNNGYKAVVWTTPDGDKPWIVDQLVRPNEVQWIRESDLLRAVQEEVQWENFDGSIWQRDPNRTHSFEAWLFTFQTLASLQCNNHTTIKDVSHTL